MNDQPNAVSEGIKRANSLRTQWLETLAAKETTFSHVVELSKEDSHKALQHIRILSILTNSEGWTERSAVEAMSHYGIGPRDTIRAIRRSKLKIEAVERLLQSNPKLFRPRPTFPDGWPFMGKLSSVYQSMPGVEMPDELLELMDELDSESHTEHVIVNDQGEGDSVLAELQLLMDSDEQ